MGVQARREIVQIKRDPVRFVAESRRLDHPGKLHDELDQRHFPFVMQEAEVRRGQRLA